ncbi:putative aldo keto reductase protein [Phaeoacremonium minimum UCRPA7]|uniref:Putative aldo keto reductase protein n=1 Tax=Phaeoacremonium minimum (strain UCR-PA7) TaxID=1286976 RepID=R8B9U9_PHAM7|nr:putative aldo keto reductase protein [Phaeoacremonium minimum UCRPA7]EON96085.1 putative aldo keto reductase protein [Phaeoacremonium minimum UCRPA7]
MPLRMTVSKYPQRKLGDTLVSAQGLGCMGMTHQYSSFGGYNDQESLRVLTRAADLGITFWDTSDIYGPFTNEELIGRWFKETGRRDEIFLATKFGNKYDTVTDKTTIDGSPEYVRQALSDSLKRLNTDHVDLYYQHRVDFNTPIEKTVEAMAQLKAEGKIRYLGLSECSARTLRRAHAVHSIAAAQMEFSPFALEIESEQTNFLATARELGVKIVAYSPLGRGFLTGTIKSRADFDEGDNRLNHPRFSEENFADNLRLVETLSALAKEKGTTPSRLALAWVLAQGDAGTKHVKYLEDNVGAIDVHFTKEDELRVRKAIETVGGAKGSRYPSAMLAKCFGDSVELD